MLSISLTFHYRKHWASLQDYIDVRQSEAQENGEELGFDTIQKELQECIFFDRYQTQKCFKAFELLPGVIAENRKVAQRFETELDLQTYLLKKLFGRKKAFTDGTTLQDWLYLFPSKLAIVKDIRESIQKLGCALQSECPGPAALQKIIDADLIISEELKNVENC